jgi:hypothetical protein
MPFQDAVYLFGASWRYVRRTLLVAVEEDGDPYGLMVPTAEIIRFYYARSTRLAQALFWGEYKEAFNIEQFVQAVELLAEQHHPCEVGFIGIGEGDTSFGAHTLATRSKRSFRLSIHRICKTSPL